MAKTIYGKLSEERKEQQAKGLVPEWVTTAGYQMFKDRYLYQTDSMRGQFERIADTAARHMPKKHRDTAREKFFELMWNGWMSCSTPVLSNMGTNRGMPVACSGSDIDDSIDSFYSSAYEAAILTKHGFGTSSYLGNIRPRGSKISTGGKASGVVPVFKHFVSIMRDVSQSGVRRGSWAGYLPIDHGDFDELVDYIKENPDDANVGWNVSDEFIERLKAQDDDALRRFKKALKMKMLTGKGYFFFIDEVNRQNPPMYKDLGLKVKASNLCVSGDTIIRVKRGGDSPKTAKNIKIADFVDKFNDGDEWQVYSRNIETNRNCWSKVTAAAMTNPNAKTLVVMDKTTKKKVKATADHQFFTSRGYVQAKDLTENDELVVFRSKKKSTGLKIDLGDECAVYDLTVENTHNFFANDILVHNCSEITLHSDKEHTFTCVLASMNLARYDEWKDTDAVFWAICFLDCVCSEFIEKGKKIKGLEKAIRATEKGRAVGLGAMGLHTLFQKRRIPFEDIQAFLLNTEIFKHIEGEAKRASRWLADRLGEPEWCKGYGVRNTHLLAIAPNKSSALLMGGVSEGINPDPAIVYTQMTAAGEVSRINPVFLELMKERGMYKKKIVADIAEHFGSVQHLDWLTDEEKAVFKTAFEINQETIVNMASARQNFICQSQSLNLFFSANEEEAWIAHIHKKAFESNIKALYYVTTMTGIAPSRDCVACEG